LISLGDSYVAVHLTCRGEYQNRKPPPSCKVVLVQEEPERFFGQRVVVRSDGYIDWAFRLDARPLRFYLRSHGIYAILPGIRASAAAIVRVLPEHLVMLRLMDDPD